MIKVNLLYFHMIQFLNQLLAASGIILEGKMELHLLRPTVPARQSATGHASYPKKIGTLKPLITLTQNSYRTYELSILIPPSQEITTQEPWQSTNTICRGKEGTPSPICKPSKELRIQGMPDQIGKMHLQAAWAKLFSLQMCIAAPHGHLI